jgi:hypothetical protein
MCRFRGFGRGGMAAVQLEISVVVGTGRGSILEIFITPFMLLLRTEKSQSNKLNKQHPTFAYKLYPQGLS